MLSAPPLAGLAALGIALFAFGLRAYSVDWGLPYTDNVDEAPVLNIALSMLQRNDLHPHYFVYPSLYLYLLLAVSAAHYHWGLAAGWYQSLDQMTITTYIYTTIPGFFVWGRMLTVVIATLTVVSLYRLGAVVWSRGAGLIGALFLAASSFHLGHSQFVSTDVTSAWFPLLAFTAAVAVAQRGRWRDYLLAGMLAGLAAATKYNAGTIALTIAVAHLLFWKRDAPRNAGRLAGAAVAALAGFLAGTPYALIAWPEFLQALRRHASHYAGAAHGDYIGAWNIGAYAEFFWTDGLRPEGCAALVLGIALLLRHRRQAALLWLSFATCYLLFMLRWQTHFMRNLMPLIVLCGLPIGVAGAAIVERAARYRRRLAVPAALAVVLVLFAVPVRDALIFSLYKAKPNSKVLADNLVRTLPRGQRIAGELNAVAWAGDPIVEPVEMLTVRPLAWYRANNYRYLIANENLRAPTDAQAYRAFKDGTTTVRVFPGEAAGAPGPRIEVLEIAPDPQSPAIARRAVDFAGGLRLLGFEARPGPLRPAITPLEGANQRVLAAGDELQLNLVWQTTQRLPHDYALFIHVLDGTGQKVVQRDTLIRGDDYPTSRWQPGELAVDRADLPLAALAPGTYRLVLGVYRMDTLERLMPAQPEAGDQTSLILTEVEIR